MIPLYQTSHFMTDLFKDDEYLYRVVVNTQGRTFKLLGSEGSEIDVSCDSVEEFMNVLKFCRSVLTDELQYVMM